MDPPTTGVAGKVEPVFVEDIDNLAATLSQTVRSGDVVLCMGAGSIGSVPAKLVDLLRQDGHFSEVQPVGKDVPVKGVQ